MRIADVTTYVVKLTAGTAYLGRLDDGSELTPDAGYRVRAPWRSLYSGRFETMLTRIRTDDGAVGWGEALAPVAPEVPAEIVNRMLGPWLVGQDPRAVRPLWRGMRDLMRERGHLVGHQADAMAAIDIALWDLLGRITGLPVWQLLGGTDRTAIPAYVSGVPEPTDAERARRAADWQARGARMIKLALGKGVDADLATFDAVAAAAPDCRIAVDAHWAYPIGEAIELGQALDDRGALFLEAPLAPEDVGGHAELARRVRLPIAIGEAMRNRFEFAQWFEQRAIGLAQPDVARTGITEAMAISELASAQHVPVAFHHSVGLGIAYAAGIHASAATGAQECPYLEFQPDTVPMANRILHTPLDAGPTGFAVPDQSGLGIEVDETAIEAAVQESEAR